MGLLASSDWREHVVGEKPAGIQETLIDLVVAEIERIHSLTPDALDVPFLREPIDRFDHASLLPFEVRTWQLIADSGAVDDIDVMVLVSGTFRELMDRLGDARAALDVAVTGTSWVRKNSNGQYGFTRPEEPGTLHDAVRLLRERAYRGSGRRTTNDQYSSEWAEAIGKRLGVGLSRRWTLDACSEHLEVTRERVRQVEKAALWVGQVRAWGNPAILDELSSLVLDSDVGTDLVVGTGESVSREDAIELLVGYGYPEDVYQGPWTVDDELELLGLNPREVRRFAYGESENTGFITREELRHHVGNRFPVLIGEMFEEIIDGLVVMDGLPYGYVYLENSWGSSVKRWLVGLLSALGPQTFEESYRAMERHHKARRSGLVFPPRAVIKEFMVRDPGFWFADDVVGLTDGASRELSGVERWVQDTICGCSGQVIHRTELWSKARDNNVKGGTLNMYSGYSLYFKPMSGGLLTMTGMVPAEVMCELARQRASAIRVPTRRGVPSITGGIVSIPVEVGNDLLDGGVFSSTMEIRKMLAGQKYKALAAGKQFGNINWSHNQMTGFTGVLRELGVQPGDQVLFVFSVVDGEMTAELATE